MAHRSLLGRALFLRSQRVALNARFLPLAFPPVFSIALGLTCCCLLTARDCASCSCSCSSSIVSVARDRRLNLRQIILSLPSSVLLTSCLRSHPRGILATGKAFGSRKAASVWSHVWSKEARCARLCGEGTMAGGDGIMMLDSIEYRLVTCTPCTETVLRRCGIVGSACRPVEAAATGNHNKHWSKAR
jgi:hypothetical protein